jgi:hypothetical protein
MRKEHNTNACDMPNSPHMLNKRAQINANARAANPMRNGHAKHEIGNQLEFLQFDRSTLLTSTNSEAAFV